MASSINIGSMLVVVVELGMVDRALQLAHSLQKVGCLLHRGNCMHPAVRVTSCLVLIMA